MDCGVYVIPLMSPTYCVHAITAFQCPFHIITSKYQSKGVNAGGVKLDHNAQHTHSHSLACIQVVMGYPQYRTPHYIRQHEENFSLSLIKRTQTVCKQKQKTTHDQPTPHLPQRQSTPVLVSAVASPSG